MPSTEELEQQLSDAGEDLARLAAAKDAEIARLRNTIGWEASVAYRAEIASLTEQRDDALAARDGETLRAQGALDALNDIVQQHDKALAQAARDERNSWADAIRERQKGKTELDLAGIKACAEAALIRPGHVIASAREVLAMIENVAALTEQRDRAMAGEDRANAECVSWQAQLSLALQERDRAMRVVRALYKFAARPWIKGADVTWPEWDAAYAEADALFAILAAEAAAETEET